MVRGGAQKKTVIRSVRVPHLAGHHLEELGELDLAGAVGVNVGDHLAKLLLLDLEAEGAHGRLELAVVDGAGVVRVEEVERLADLLDLLLRESGLLGLAAGGSAAHCCSWGRERRLRVRFQRGARLGNGGMCWECADQTQGAAKGCAQTRRVAAIACLG